MKHFADKSRRDVEYEVGQLVYVRLRPHRQLSVRDQSTSKLTKRYFRPFQILERIGNVAYRLKLPDGSRIHPVFHCSMLRPHHGPFELPTSSLPPHALDNQPILRPLVILDSRLDTSTTPPTRFVLVQWEGFAPKDSTWEKWDDLCHSHHLEDNVIFPGGDNDSTSSHLEEDDPVVPREARPRRICTRPKHVESYV